MLKVGRANETDFTRERVFTFTKLAMFIINLAKKSLQIEVYNFTDWLSLPSVTKQAFSKARKKLLPKTFQLLNQKFIDEFYSENTIKTLKGLRVLAIDGSSLRLPTDAELCKKFESITSENKDVPLAKISIMFDVLNCITLDSHIDTYLASERTMALNHINQLLQQDKNLINQTHINDLFLFDRGYQSLFLIYYLLSKKKHFLFRVTEKFISEIKEVISNGAKDIIISINAFSHDRRRPNDDFGKYLSHIEKLPIKVRVAVFDLSSGEKEIIITSLMDQEEFTYNDLFKIYDFRWGAEEEYKYYKVITEMENFSGKTVLAIEQDFYATVFACNLNAMLMLEAQEELEFEKEGFKYKYKYKVNRNILVGIIKNEIINVFLTDCDLEKYCEKLKDRIKKNLIPIRPNRTFPRVYKRVRSTVNRRAL